MQSEISSGILLGVELTNPKSWVQNQSPCYFTAAIPLHDGSQSST